ncbi:MAG: metal ABC transporter ATP-binding protein [Faecalibacterium sp.]
MPQLTCQNLAVGYERTAILEGLNFTVNAGDYLCILGENGSGKSTVMKTLLGLKKPMSGSVVLGNDIAPTQIGYLTQQTEIQKEFPASVWEIVLSGCQSRCGLRPFYNKEERQIAKNAMEKMAITHLSKRCYRNLSGGQQQRVLLARALCATQKILFLDEPVSGLDPKVSAELYDLIRSLNQEDGISIVMISHDVQISVQEASHILHLGETSFFGTKEEYLQSKVSLMFQNGTKGVE